MRNKNPITKHRDYFTSIRVDPRNLETDRFCSLNNLQILLGCLSTHTVLSYVVISSPTNSGKNE